MYANGQQPYVLVIKQQAYSSLPSHIALYAQDWEKRQAQWKSSLQKSTSYAASKRHNRSLY